MFNNYYVSKTIEWVQAQPQRLILPSLTQDTATDSLEDSGSESTHSGELIEWDESPFCQLQMHKCENQMLKHRIKELQKQLEGSYGGTAAVTHGTARSSDDSGIASFDKLVSELGLISDIIVPIRTLFLREIHQRRKAETAVLNLRRDRALALEECRRAWKRMEHMMKSKSHPSIALQDGIEGQERKSESDEETQKRGAVFDGTFTEPKPT